MRENAADHVLLFTATPINRGAEDLLALIDLLGADNFEDATLRGPGPAVTTGAASPPETRAPRDDPPRDPAVHGAAHQEHAQRAGRPRAGCLPQPQHRARQPLPLQSAHPYPTGETPRTRRSRHRSARSPVSFSASGSSATQLAVPAALRRDYTDERWLNVRLSSARGPGRAPRPFGDAVLQGRAPRAPGRDGGGRPAARPWPAQGGGHW